MNFPRPLRAKEQDLILFVLPHESPGYNAYRKLIATMVVLGNGRRGTGNIVLGKSGETPDTSSPLAPVIAYGVVETTFDTFSITVREFVGEQIDIEIVSMKGEDVPDHFEEKRRWTYSSWRPLQPSPATGLSVREVTVNDSLTLAMAKQEKRLWLHDATTQINHLIPITNFYNELMLHKRIRDPNIALKANLFWENLEKYSDSDVSAAFASYNRIRKRVEFKVSAETKKETGLSTLLRKLLSKA